jgi:hypothetical protein
MERPHEFSGVDIPGANIARRSLRRILLRTATSDDQVSIHSRRRAEAVRPWQSLQDLRRVEIDAPVIAERGVWLAGLRIKREQPAATRPEYNLRGRLRVSRPVFDATRRSVTGGNPEGPDFLSCRRIEGHHASVGRADVHEAIDNDRGRLARGKSGTAAAAAPLPTTR